MLMVKHLLVVKLFNYISYEFSSYKFIALSNAYTYYTSFSQHLISRDYIF